MPCRVTARRIVSTPRRRATAMSQAPGLSGTPSSGHCSSAATRASCARSSASPTSRTTRARPAISLADSIRQTASIACWVAEVTTVAAASAARLRSSAAVISAAKARRSRRASRIFRSSTSLSRNGAALEPTRRPRPSRRPPRSSSRRPAPSSRRTGRRSPGGCRRRRRRPACPCCVGWSPSAASTMPASASCWLYRSIAANSSGVPNSPDSDRSVALPRTRTFIAVLLRVCPGSAASTDPTLAYPCVEREGADSTRRRAIAVRRGAPSPAAGPSRARPRACRGSGSAA